MAERLDRERVVRAALALLDEVGLDGLTLRRLAQDLGVKAPAASTSGSGSAPT